MKKGNNDQPLRNYELLSISYFSSMEKGRIPFKTVDYLIHNAQVSVTKCDATPSKLSTVKDMGHGKSVGIFYKNISPVTVLQPH